MEHFVMEMDWKGKQDKHVGNIQEGVMIEEYMGDKGFKRVKGSATLFKRGKTVKYVVYGECDIEKVKPKLKDYYDTFKI